MRALARLLVGRRLIFVVALVSALAWDGLAQAATSVPVASLDPTLLAGFEARSIGPAGMSGRVAAIDVVEADPKTVYVGAATGGVWKSDNAGLTWTPIFDDQPVAAIGAVSIFQANPSIVWVGTGEGNVRNSASVGNGIYKTVDGGATWMYLGLDGTERIHRIALHPSDPNIAWVAALGREWGENPERGIYKTIDGGKSWRKVLYVDEKTGGADVVIDPSNPNKLLASLWQYRRWPYFFHSGGPGSGLYVSHDGGESWKRLDVEEGLPAGELGRIGLGISRSNPEVVYALVEAAKSVLLRSDDGGASWKTVNSENDINPRPFYFGEIRVDPRDPNRVYSVDFSIRVSTDGGKNFEEVVPEIHGDFHALWINPANPAHLWVGDDGGLGESHDYGKTARFVENLPLAQYYHVALDNEVPYNVYGGLQDNGSWRGPSAVWQRGGIRNHHWAGVGYGDGFETLPDPSDATQGYSLWQGGNLMRWNLKTGEWRDSKPALPADGTRLRFNWNAALAIDPFEPATVYLGSQFVHKSTDRGETWTTVSADLTSNNPEWQKQDQTGGLTPDITGAENYTTLITIAPSPKERGVIWAGSDDGRLHVSRDGGKSWTSVEKRVPFVPANTWIPHVHPSPHAGGTAFVVWDDHRRSNWTPYVARTDDYGQTWKSLATSNLRGYALSIVQDPKDANLLFLGTEFGLWFSIDAGKNWHAFRHGVPTVAVYDLAIHPRDGDLVIATHGRAIYVLDDLEPLRALEPSHLAEKLRVYDVSAAQQYWQKSEDGGFAFGAGEFRGENRGYGALLTYTLAGDDLPLPDPKAERARKVAERSAKKARAAANKESKQEEKKEKEDQVADHDKVRIEVRDARGELLRSFRVPAQRGVNRTLWDLRRDAFPSPEPAPGEDQNPDPAGSEVPPGTYEVKLSFRGESATRTVRVVADPRSTNSEADWQTRWAAIEQAGKLQSEVTVAIERLRALRRDVAAVSERVKKSRSEDLRKGRITEKDLPLLAHGQKLEEKIAALDKRLWQGPESVGILGFDDVATRIGFVQAYLESSWAPPSAEHRLHLERAAAVLTTVRGDLDKLFAEDVAEYQKAVREAGVGLLP